MPTRTSFLSVWLLLLAASAALFLLVALVAWWQHRREVPSKAKLRAERAAWAQHATAVAEQAQQAVSEVAVLKERAQAAEAARAAAWRALEEIEEAHDKAVRRHAEAVERSGILRQREGAGMGAVTQAALGAYRRGDLTKDQLWRVLRWSNGLDPDVDQAERELYRVRAARRAAHQRYRIAADQERKALAAAELAEVRARALVEEVATASEGAGWDDGPRAEPR